MALDDTVFAASISFCLTIPFNVIVCFSWSIIISLLPSITKFPDGIISTILAAIVAVKESALLLEPCP